MHGIHFAPEEFIVEEITLDGSLLARNQKYDLGKPEDQQLQRDYFCHFVLQKRGWTTQQAIATIARRLGVRPSRFDTAGTKDKNAITTQLCSGFAIAPERLLGLDLKDIGINGAWKARQKIRIGKLGGNRFTITLTPENCGEKPDASGIASKAESAGFLFPNYFGAQRFGMRGNTHEVGRKLCLESPESAVMEYLCGVDVGEEESHRAAREKLAVERNLVAALEYFPKSLDIEYRMIEWLSSHENDYAGAFRTMPRSLQLMFVHAFQSAAWNATLLRREREGKLFSPDAYEKECKENAIGFPDEDDRYNVAGALTPGEYPLIRIPGTDGFGGKYDAETYAAIGITQESFAPKSFPELTSKGAMRPAVVKLNGFECRQDGGNAVVSFGLPPGSYATVAIDWLLGRLKPVAWGASNRL